MGFWRPSSYSTEKNEAGVKILAVSGLDSPSPSHHSHGSAGGKSNSEAETTDRRPAFSLAERFLTSVPARDSG